MLTLPIFFLLITVVSSLDSNKTTSDFIEQQLHLSYECEASKHCYHSPSGCIQTKDCTGGFSIGLLDSRDPSLGTVYEVYVVEKDIPFTSNTYAAVKTTNIETGEVEMRLCFPHEARAIVAYPSLDSLEVDESHPLSFVSSAVSLNSNAVTCVFKDSRNVDDFSKVHISSEVVYGEMSDRIFFPPKGRMRIAGETKLDTSDIGKMENKEKEEEDFFNTDKIINEAKIDSKKKEKSIEKVQPQLSEENEEKNIKNATVNGKLSSTTAKIPSTKATTPKVIVKLTTTSTTVSTTKKVSTTTVAPTTVPSESIEEEEEEDEESEEMRNEIEKKKEERNRLKEMIENDEMDRIKDLITEKVESAVEKQREHMEKEIMKKIEAEESEKEKKNNGNKKNTQSVSNVNSKKSESTIQREQFEKRENEGFRSMDDEESDEMEEKVEKKKTKDVKKGENTEKKEDDYEVGEEDEVEEKKEGGEKSTTQSKKHPKDIRSGDAESLDGEDDSSSTVPLFICVLLPLLLTL